MPLSAGEKELLDALEAAEAGRPLTERQMGLVVPEYGKRNGNTAELNERGRAKLAELRRKLRPGPRP